MKVLGVMHTHRFGIGRDWGVGRHLPGGGWRGRGFFGRRSGSGGRQAPEAGHVVGEGVPEEHGPDLLDAAYQQAEEAAVAGLGVDEFGGAAGRPPWRRRCPCSGATRRWRAGRPAGPRAGGARCAGLAAGRRPSRLARRGRRCRRACEAAVDEMLARPPVVGSQTCSR
jgi:hypothetical protein